MTRASVLWLHRMGTDSLRRQSVADFERMLEPFTSHLSTVIWDSDLGAPSNLRRRKWNLVVFGPTFLASRNKAFFSLFKKEFAWLSDIQAIKVAFPQDEYDGTHALNEWLLELGADVVYTCFPHVTEALYGPLKATGVEVRGGFAAVISETLIQRASTNFFQPKRPVDVVYRAHSTSKRFGELGWMKVRIGPEFEERLINSDRNIVSDISSRNEDTIFGPAWLDFLQSSKFVLTVPSGSSVWDYFGSIRRALRFEDSVTFESRAWDSNKIPEWAKKISFEGLSPRHVEAAVLGTVQIAFDGTYSGVLVPGEHMICLARDFSNFDEVLEMMCDSSLRRKIAAAAFEAVTSQKGLHPKKIHDDLCKLAFIEPNSPSKYSGEKIDYHAGPLLTAEIRVRQSSTFIVFQGLVGFRRRLMSLVRRLAKLIHRLAPRSFSERQE